MTEKAGNYQTGAFGDGNEEKKSYKANLDHSHSRPADIEIMSFGNEEWKAV